jgi:hypothetical protein
MGIRFSPGLLRGRRRAASCLLPLVAAFVAGCGSEAGETPDASPAPPATATAFDAGKVGSVTGRVTWRGPLPIVPAFHHPVPQPNGGYAFGIAPNPNAPQIDAKTRAVGGVVVSLRGIDPAAAHPWDLPPVSVEIGKGTIAVIQGDRRGRVGFVRRGDSVSVSSDDGAYHVLRGRGDAFFGLALPTPGDPVKRTLNNPGRVELSSGTGLFSLRADLFVIDHPYFTLTDAEGRFTLERVPAGRVEVVAWHPGWEKARTERDPDTTLEVRMTYSPPLERVSPASVTAGGKAEVGFSLP